MSFKEKYNGKKENYERFKLICQMASPIFGSLYAKGRHQISDCAEISYDMAEYLMKKIEELEIK